MALMRSSYRLATVEAAVGMDRGVDEAAPAPLLLLALPLPLCHIHPTDGTSTSSGLSRSSGLGGWVSCWRLGGLAPERRPAAIGPTHCRLPTCFHALVCSPLW